MDQKISVLMNIIKGEVCASPVDMAAFLALGEEEQEALIQIARKHSVLQLVGDALGKDPATKNLPLTQSLLLETFQSLQRTEKIEAERRAICRVLEEAEIPYIQLKGSRLRPLYPEPWMRSSGDIDILVQEDQAERAAQLLMQQRGYKRGKVEYHDIHLYAKTGVLLELHFHIKEDTQPMDSVLERVWSYSRPAEEGRSEYLQSNEYFLFHLIAHMAYHFISGGCGIRTFVDLLVLRDRFAWDDDAVRRLCRQAGVDHFYQNVQALVGVWFDGRPHTAVTRRMEEYVLSGGTFGNHTNHVAAEKGQSGGKLAYIGRRLWRPTDKLCHRYPSLEKHLWLMPAYQVRRWLDVFLHGDTRRITKEMEIVQTMDASASSEIEQMLRENGLL